MALMEVQMVLLSLHEPWGPIDSRSWLQASAVQDQISRINRDANTDETA